MLFATVIRWRQWTALLLAIAADLFRVLIPVLAAVFVWWFLLVHDMPFRSDQPSGRLTDAVGQGVCGVIGKQHAESPYGS